MGRELQQRNLGLWWDSAPAGKAAAAPDTQGRAAGGAANSKIDSPEHVCSQHGLFPAPMAAGCSPADRKKKVEAFQVCTAGERLTKSCTICTIQSVRAHRLIEKKMVIMIHIVQINR